MVNRIGVLMLLVLPLCAEDGATLYKAKCASCHGASGSGRRAIAGSDLLADACKKKSDAELRASIASGGKDRKATHAYEKKGLDPAQIDLVLRYVRELQKK